MDRARAEYDKYFTPGGSERRNVFADRDELEEIRSNLAKGQERLAEVDEVVDSLSRINEQISHDQTVVASKKTDCQKLRLPLRASPNSRRRSRPPNVLPRKQRSVMPRPRGPTT